MAPPTDKIAGVEPGVRELAEHHTILESMVLAKQEELRELNHLVNITQASLNRLKQDHEEQLRTHQRTLDIKKEEHDTLLEQDRMGLKQRESELNQRDNNLNSWEKDLKAWEERVEPIKEAQAKLTEERIAVEQQRVRAGEIEQRASQVEQVYAQRMAELLERESTVKALEIKHTSLAQELESREQEQQKSAKQVALDLENLTALRTELDPKLADLAQKQKEVEERNIRADSLHKEAGQRAAENDQTHADLQGLAQRLEVREKILNDKEIQLKQLESELRLKEQQTKAKE